MLPIDDVLQNAMDLFHAGKLAESAKICQQVVGQFPDNVQALGLLGLIHHQAGDNLAASGFLQKATALAPLNLQLVFNYGIVLMQLGRTAEAETAFRKAVQIDLDLAEAHFNLANALAHQNRLTEAISAYKQAVSIQPDYHDAYFNLGVMYKDLQMFDQAAETLQKATSLRPDSSSSFFYLGLAYHAQGQLQSAMKSYRRALAITPGYRDACYNLGITAHALGNAAEAVRYFQKTLAINPDDPAALNNLGLALQDNGKIDEAMATFKQAIVIRPDFHEALSNLGNLLLGKDQFAEAAALYLQAVSIAPDFSEAWYNLGNCYTLQQNVNGAIDVYRQALAKNPDLVQAHWNLSHALLLNGQYAEGFKEYTWRWRRKEAVVPNIPKPEWHGEALPQGTLLVHAEQGLGDSIQFVRYLSLVNPRVNKIFLACDPSLAQIFQSVAGLDAIIDQDNIPQFLHIIDVQIPLLNLPTLFTTSAETIPSQVPYIFADTKSLRDHAPLFAGHEQSFKVGIVWQGNPAHRNDRQRSCRQEEFTALLDVPGCAFFSLQKEGKGSDPALRITDLGPGLASFTDTAACIAHLDLVISVDTAVAHLAGAMGKPVWTLLPFVPDWRWLVEGEQTPWYPTMRLFRRSRKGGWDEVFIRIREELTRMVRARS